MFTGYLVPIVFIQVARALLHSSNNCTSFLIFTLKSMVMVFDLHRLHSMKRNVFFFCLFCWSFCILYSTIMWTQHYKYLWFLFSQLFVSLLNIWIYWYNLSICECVNAIPTQNLFHSRQKMCYSFVLQWLLSFRNSNSTNKTILF